MIHNMSHNRPQDLGSVLRVICEERRGRRRRADETSRKQKEGITVNCSWIAVRASAGPPAHVLKVSDKLLHMPGPQWQLHKTHSWLTACSQARLNLVKKSKKAIKSDLICAFTWSSLAPSLSFSMSSSCTEYFLSTIHIILYKIVTHLEIPP